MGYAKMSAKLHINFSQGILDVEGEESFVKSIYDDFRDEALRNFATGLNDSAAEEPNAGAGSSAEAALQTKRRRKAARQKSESGKVKQSDYNPKFNRDLDLSQLTAFYDQFAPKNHSEKILIFSVFLRDKLKNSRCAT